MYAMNKIYNENGKKQKTSKKKYIINLSMINMVDAPLDLANVIPKLSFYWIEAREEEEPTNREGKRLEA